MVKIWGPELAGLELRHLGLIDLTALCAAGLVAAALLLLAVVLVHCGRQPELRATAPELGPGGG